MCRYNTIWDINNSLLKKGKYPCMTLQGLGHYVYMYSTTIECISECQDICIRLYMNS